LEVLSNVTDDQTKLNLLKKENAKPKEITIAWKNINVHLNLQPTLIGLASKISESKEKTEISSKHIIKNGISKKNKNSQIFH
jgi:hypothetical protein